MFPERVRAAFPGSAVSACLQWQGDMNMFYLGEVGQKRTRDCSYVKLY